MKNTRFPVFITYLFIGLVFLTSCTNVNQTSPWGSPSDRQPAPVIDKGTQAGNIYGYNQAINVALLLPLSGKNAALGKSMLQAAQLALFETNNINLNLIPLDTQGTASGAQNAAQQAINQSSQLILGPVFSQSVAAVKPIAKSNNVNVIAFSTDQSLADPSTFLMGFMPSTQAEAIANHAVKNGLKHISVVAPRNTYGDIVSNAFKNAVKRNGGMIKQVIRYVPNDPQLGTNISKMSSDVDAVFIPASQKEARAISDYLDQNNMRVNNVKRLGTGLWDNSAIARVPALQGGLFANPSPQKYAFFKDKYKSAYGENPARIASLAFDATALAATLIQNGMAQQNPQPFSQRLIINANGYAGADGVFRFLPNGIVQRQLSILELRDGSIIEIVPSGTQF